MGEELPRTSRFQTVLAWSLIPLVALLLTAVIVLYVLFTTAIIEGDSMFPSLHAGDYILVERGYDTPIRGDVIVYETTLDDGVPIRVVKRVIAVPGDTIEVVSGRAHVNGQVEVCDYCVLLQEGDTSVPPYVVPEGQLFLLGDNRPYSLDSRHYGPVPLDKVIGQAVLIFAPFDHIGQIDEPFLAD